jgi:hypothetical protein
VRTAGRTLGQRFITDHGKLGISGWPGRGVDK